MGGGLAYSRTVLDSPQSETDHATLLYRRIDSHRFGRACARRAQLTYFTTEHVTGPLGFFAWEVDRPHTIFISPLAGIVVA